ncbi:sensor histidine kinase [Actinomadura scrupuli]|uniref:sensor histidine kinase n=1 Tax=Actinomadura scrupuli TaxID=559629 RepID=UPI003D96EDDF
MLRLLRPLIALTTWRRWVYLILGGALLTPYLIASMVLGSLGAAEHGNSLIHSLVTVVALIVPIVVTGLVPAVRVMEGTAARELLGAPETIGDGRPWRARLRTSGWFTGHLLAGGVMGLLSLGLPAGAVGLFALPLRGHSTRLAFFTVSPGWSSSWLPASGLVLLVAFGYSIAGVGALATRLAPVLLGPSSADRLAEAERRATTLAERNRLARELHDSVGHALSIVTVQAGAAARVLDADPAFARQALAAIEESARHALEDLDHVLGLLREEAAGTAPQRTLKDLDGLLRTTRMAGVEIDAHVEGEPGQLPAAVSREAFRIVQEGLTNTLRHAGKVPVTLRLAVLGERLELEMINPLGARGDDRRGGGRGLPGIRERVTVLRGQMTAGPGDGHWRVSVTIPLRRAGQ